MSVLQWRCAITPRLIDAGLTFASSAPAAPSVREHLGREPTYDEVFEYFHPHEPD